MLYRAITRIIFIAVLLFPGLDLNFAQDVFSSNSNPCDPTAGTPECERLRFGWGNCPGSRNPCDWCYDRSGRIVAFVPRTNRSYSLASQCDCLSGTGVTWVAYGNNIRKRMERAGGECEPDPGFRLGDGAFICSNVDPEKYKQLFDTPPCQDIFASSGTGGGGDEFGSDSDEEEYPPGDDQDQDVDIDDDTQEDDPIPPEMKNCEGLLPMAPQFHPVGKRRLIFVNNPEQLLNGADPYNDLNKILIKASATPGEWRNFFEHVNRTGRSIHYVIEAFNPTEKPVSITVRGSHYTTNGNQGGIPFQMLFNSKRNAAPGKVFTIRGGTVQPLMPMAIPSGSFFSGVIDFEVAGTSTVEIRNVVVAPGVAQTVNLPYSGFVERIERDPIPDPKNPNKLVGTCEHRMYKGVTDFSELEVNDFDFVIDDQILSDQQREGSIHKWQTHSVNSQDLVPFRLGSREFRPDDKDHCECPSHRPTDLTHLWCTVQGSKCRCEEKHLNLGNWGIVYGYNGKITNCSGNDLCVTFHVGASGEAIAIAFGSEKRWEAARIEKQKNKGFYSVDVKKGETEEFHYQYVLGGPSGTNLQNFVTVKPGSCSGATLNR